MTGTTSPSASSNQNGPIMPSLAVHLTWLPKPCFSLNVRAFEFCHVSWCEFLLYLDPLWVQMNWSTWIQRLNSQLNLWMDFFGLFPTDSLTAFRLRRVPVLSFLPDLGVSAFLLSLFTDPVTRNLCVRFSGDGCWSWTSRENLLLLLLMIPSPNN